MKYFLGFFCVIYFLTATASGANERSVTLQLPWLHQFQFAGYYAAQEQGFYKEAGFEVFIKEGRPEISAIEEVENGQADFGVCRSEILVKQLEGSPLVALAAIFQHSASIFLTKKESGIASPRDMIGHRVMLLEGIDAAEYLAVLKNEGVTDEDIVRLSSSYNIDDLINNKTDVFNAYITNEPFYLEENNIPCNIIRPADYGVDFYGDILFTSQKEVSDNLEQVKAFRDASVRGWRYALDHQEEIIDLLISKYGVKKTREHLQFEAEAVRNLIMQDLVEIGYINPDRWRRIAEIFVDLGLVEGPCDLDVLDEGLDLSPYPINKTLNLTLEEEAYLKNKKVIKMCNNPNWAPIEFAKDGNLNNMQGIAIETLKILENKLNIRFENVPTGNWSESQQLLKEKRCDILPCAVNTSIRSEYANFTKPYLNLPLAIFTTKDKHIVSGLDEIMDKPWTRRKGSGLITKLKKEYPDMKVIETRGDQEAMQYVNSGQAYFTIATLPMASHVISRFMLTDLHVAGYTGMVYNLSIAVRDDDPILLSILDKALADISKDAFRRNFRKWVSNPVREPVTDYKLMLKIFAAVFIVIVLLIYRQHILNSNIAKLKVAEDLANSEKERLLVTLRSIGDGVIATDLEGNVLLLNKISENLTGWSQEDAVGRPIQEVFNAVHEVTGQRCENPVEKVLAKGQIVELANHTVLLSRDGTRRTIEDSAAPIFDEQSKIVGIVLVYRDVTEQRRTREELIKAKKLESVGVLAGGIAHDFNNILAAILGNIELAGLALDPEAEVQDLLKDAEKASIRAKGLTQQLLTFAKGGNPVKKTASIASIITDSANFVLHGSSVICNFNIPENLWKADVDAGQISQVIQNIIINGRQAMPDGGVIEVSCENISNIEQETVSLPQNKYIKICISDSGCGISQKYVGRVFDPYFSTKHEGSGLGLAICHSIIRKHEGNISVVSTPNEGTIFTLYLRATMSQSVETETPESIAVPDLKKGTIMVMDDEPMVQKIVKRMLENAGHEVLLVSDGNEAVEVYGEFQKKGRPIDLIIMDLTIPGGMGGEDAVKKILGINADAKVIVASGYSHDPVMASYQECGFCASIAKPFRWDELENAVESALRTNG